VRDMWCTRGTRVRVQRRTSAVGIEDTTGVVRKKTDVCTTEGEVQGDEIN